MFAVWSGRGILVMGPIVGGLFLADFFAKIKPKAHWPQYLAVVITSLAILGLALLLNQPKIIGKDEDGNAVTVKIEHTLYWIPVMYWPGIVLVIGSMIVYKM